MGQMLEGLEDRFSQGAVYQYEGLGLKICESYSSFAGVYD